MAHMAFYGMTGILESSIRLAVYHVPALLRDIPINEYCL